MDLVPILTGSIQRRLEFDMALMREILGDLSRLTCLSGKYLRALEHRSDILTPVSPPSFARKTVSSFFRDTYSPLC